MDFYYKTEHDPLETKIIKPEGDRDFLKVYVKSIADHFQNIGLTDHPLLCKKCKANSWNMLKKITDKRLRANCTACGNVQVLTKVNVKDSFIEVKIK